MEEVSVTIHASGRSSVSSYAIGGFASRQPATRRALINESVNESATERSTMRGQSNSTASGIARRSTCYTSTFDTMSSLEGWNLDARPVVKETLLSRKPARASFPIALGSVVVLVAASLLYWSNAADLASFLPASAATVFGRGEYWRLFTTILIHADFQHLLSNGIVFGILAFLVYGYYGPLVYPLLTFGLGALVTALSLRTYPPDTFLLGASGVVYLMAAFWLTLYLLVERSTAPRMRLVRAVGFGLIVLVPTAVEPAVSYRTHGIGFAIGVSFGIAYFWKRKRALRTAERIELE